MANLYLNTCDVEVLERAAGVPAGTKERYDAFLMETSDLDSYEAYCKCHEDKDLSRWNQFILYGFGKFNYPVEGPCGKAVGHLAVEMMFSATHGGVYGECMLVLNLVKEYGVCWY